MDPDNQVLIEGVLFRARYLGSTQLVTDGNPTKLTRMLQAQEAVGRIKVSWMNYFYFSRLVDSHNDSIRLSFSLATAFSSSLISPTFSTLLASTLPTLLFNLIILVRS